MDEELKQQLEQISDTLKAIALNQAMVYAELKKIEGKTEEKSAE